MALSNLSILSLLAGGSTAGLHVLETATELLLLVLVDVGVGDASLRNERMVRQEIQHTDTVNNYMLMPRATYDSTVSGNIQGEE